MNNLNIYLSAVHGKGIGSTITYLSVIEVRQTAKAVNYKTTQGNSFWLPKAAISVCKSGLLKGELVLAGWFGFDESTMKRVAGDILLAGSHSFTEEVQSVEQESKSTPNHDLKGKLLSLFGEPKF